MEFPQPGAGAGLSTPPDRVVFNVGGQRFETRRSTITLAQKGTMLEAMLSGQYSVELDRDGAVFLDRDPKFFRLFLNYLRTGQVVLPKKKHKLLEILLEAQFYGAQEIEEKIYKKLDVISDEMPSLQLLGKGAALIFADAKWNHDAMTVEYWVKAEVCQESSVFWFRGFSNGTDSRFQMHAPWADGTIYLDYGGYQSSWPAYGRVQVGGRLPPGSGWHHVAATSHGASAHERGMRIYVDGELVARSDQSDRPQNPSTTLIIGGEHTNCYFHRGALRDFRIWKRVRTHDEIRASMRARLTGKEPDLWFFLPLDTPVNPGDVVTDLAGGLTAQLQPNTATWNVPGQVDVFEKFA